jgi:hypothetical protein
MIDPHADSPFLRVYLTKDRLVPYSGGQINWPGIQATVPASCTSILQGTRPKPQATGRQDWKGSNTEPQRFEASLAEIFHTFGESS